ncbi:MAG: zinc-dependent metalloprotease [Polyangia bacterium]
MSNTTTTKSSMSRPFSRRVRHLTLTALAACGLWAACSPTEEQANINLDEHAPFVIIPRATNAQTKALRERALKAAGVIDQAGVGDDFYLAINKSELGTDKKWFLSAYLKQFFPNGVSYGAARSLGTRVVSFKAQNGKLFVFDTDSRKKQSDTFDPEVLVEAYPIVAYPAFDRLPGASQFVLFDPAAGMNRFSLLQDAFAGGSNPDKFNVELAYSQRYRSLTDGITFESVFTGYGIVKDPSSSDGLEDHQYRSSGTLGMAIRRYAETTGYTQSSRVQIDGQDIYFTADPRIVPNTGSLAQGVVKWAVSAAKPIQWVVSADIDKLQADPRFMGIDLYGAIAKGVTNWNSVFGYDALKVRKATKDDSYADDDTNMILVDLDPSFGAAFANWRSNPNTGEIRGASVYFNSLWAEIADLIFDDDPTMPLTALRSVERPKIPMLTWNGIGRSKDDCVLWAPIYKGTGRPSDTTDRPIPIPADTKLTRKAKIEQYITHVVLHEVGHTLGLRHNFKGSLKVDPAKNIVTSSVMEYIDDFDAVNADKPQSFDIDAIKLLYGLAATKPTDKFCNDSGVALEPDCRTFDQTDDPYSKVYLPSYTDLLKDFLDNKTTTSPSNTLNGVLDYVRTATTVANLNKFWNGVMDTAGYSLKAGKADAMKIKDPTFAARTDFMARRVIQRLFLDDASLRGRFTNDPPSEATFNASVLAEVKAMIKNTDGIRTVASRKVAANFLKKKQSVEAFNILREGYAQLTGDLAAGKFKDPSEEAQAVDLVAYMDKLMAPYFNN